MKTRVRLSSNSVLKIPSSGSNAADTKVTQNFDGMVNSLLQRNSLEIDRDFMSLIDKDPIWTYMPLAECDPGTVFIPATRKINTLNNPSATGGVDK
jgi:hypothetical protein